MYGDFLCFDIQCWFLSNSLFSMVLTSGNGYYLMVLITCISYLVVLPTDKNDI